MHLTITYAIKVITNTLPIRKFNTYNESINYQIANHESRGSIGTKHNQHELKKKAYQTQPNLTKFKPT